MIHSYGLVMHVTIIEMQAYYKIIWNASWKPAFANYCDPFNSLIVWSTNENGRARRCMLLTVQQKQGGGTLLDSNFNHGVLYMCAW